MKFKIVFFQDGQSVVIYCDIIMSQRNIRSSSRQPSNFLLEWLIDVKNINIFKNNFHKTYIKHIFFQVKQWNWKLKIVQYFNLHSILFQVIMHYFFKSIYNIYLIKLTVVFKCLFIFYLSLLNSYHSYYLY